MTTPETAGRSFAPYFALAVLALLFLLFYLAVDGYFSQAHNPNQASFINEDFVLELQIAQDGHYRAMGRINGQEVTFLLDTGASDTALSEKVAQRLNVRKLGSTYGHTANGVVQGQHTVLDEVDLGGLKMHKVSAVILPNMDDEVLLGMSFLRHFDWQQSAGVLSLRGRTP